MKVLFVTSEANPFIKTGGLGDVMGALPQALLEKGVEAKVILPKYKNIKEDYLNKLKFIKNFNVKVGWRDQYCGVFESEYKGVTYYFIDNEYYFNRDTLYGHGDDAERFAFFDRAVLEAIKEINWKPDIIHCNDWHSGMIPVLDKVQYKKDEFYKNIKTVFSIHNLLFTGTFKTEILPDLFGYDYTLAANGDLELYGGVSFMKGALNFSDRISTVSKSYANEIQTAEFGEKLDGLLRCKQNILSGIVNGIDYDEFNPASDKLIAENFDSKSIKDKSKNKIALQKELGLPENKDIPMIGLVSRLTNQKGCNLIIEIIDKLLYHDVQLVIVGTGDYQYEEQFKNLQNKYRGKLSSNIKFDNKLAHKVYAASDMFLMPSLFEPCGLGQLIALRYGAIPVVRETGGLKDTIIPYNKFDKTGNGFGFRNYNSYELLIALESALEIYKNKEEWNNLVKNAMNCDNSWSKSAGEYLNLYNELI